MVIDQQKIINEFNKMKVEEKYKALRAQYCILVQELETEKNSIMRNTMDFIKKIDMRIDRLKQEIIKSYQTETKEKANDNKKITKSLSGDDLQTIPEKTDN
jgi:hypothetical protein